MFKRIFIGLGAFLILLTGALFIIPSLIPTDTYREKLETELSRVMARDVSVTGDIDISTFPVIRIQTGGISLANPRGYGAEDFVSVEGLSAKVKLWPLLRKTVEISQIELNAPNIWLERKPNGEVNWISSGTPAETAPTEVSAQSYKRDGRYTAYDPSLDLLRVKNGQVRFLDPANDRDVSVSDINLDLRAPTLDQPLKLDGDALYDGLNVTLEGQFSTPLSFLNGETASFTASVETEVGKVGLNGAFRASETVAFDTRFDVSSSNPMALSERLPIPDTVTIPALESFAASGKLGFVSGIFDVSELATNVQGEAFDFEYSGTATAGKTLAADGSFTANLSDTTIVSPYLQAPVPALDAIDTLDAKGRVKWNGQSFDVSDLNANVSGALIEGQFDGIAATGDTLSGTGVFEIATPNLAGLVKVAGLDQPDAAALKRVVATGTVSLEGDRLDASGVSAQASDGALNGSFEGDILFNDSLSLSGVAKAEIPDLASLNSTLARDIPYSEIVNRIQVSTIISTAKGTYVLDKTEATLADGDINGRFDGRLAFGVTPDILGTLSLNTPSVRTLANKTNVSLPANTSDGVIFEGLALSGTVEGSPEVMEFKNGKLSLDNLSGDGNFALNLTSARPRLTGEIALSETNLRPYLAAWTAQRPVGEIVPWSTTPINLSALDAIDADLRITAPSIQFTRLELGTTNALISLQNGQLKSTISDTQIYGGAASGMLTLQAPSGRPALEISANVKRVQAQDLMMTMGGFDKVTGTSNFEMKITGQGESQAEIMKSLSGSGAFDALNGKLLGVDAGALLTGIDTAITNRQLPAGLGLGKTTDFKDLAGLFTLENGRVKIGAFQLQAGDFSMESDGEIDLGAQSIDIGIRPKLNDGSDFANFGVPIRFTGAFGQAKPGLDTDMLSQIAQAKARRSAGDAVKDRVGGSLGNILGGVITGGTPASDTTPTETPTEPDPEKQDVQPEETAPQTPEDLVKDSIKGLFGRKKDTDKSE